MAQDFGEQLVIAVPLAPAVESDQEQVVALEAAQQRVGILDLGHRCAQRAGEAGEDRGAQQEVTGVGRLAVQHLVAQVVHDLLVVSREGLDELLRVALDP